MAGYRIFWMMHFICNYSVFEKSIIDIVTFFEKNVYLCLDKTME